MKKILAFIALALFLFTGCEKEELFTKTCYYQHYTYDHREYDIQSEKPDPEGDNWEWAENHTTWDYFNIHTGVREIHYGYVNDCTEWVEIPRYSDTSK